MLRYLATALLIWVATPNLHKQPDISPPHNPVEHQVQLVSEIQEPQLDKKEVAAPIVVQPPKGCEHYVDLVNQYSWNKTVALNVMRAESGCNPSAVGDNRVIGGIYAPSCGLMQVRTLKGRPSCDQLKDPATNLAWAYKLYQGGGWKHWSVCKTTVRCS